MAENLGKALITRDSGKAVLVELDDHVGAKWIPKSVIHDDSEVWEGAGSEGDLIVEDWFAEKEGFV